MNRHNWIVVSGLVASMVLAVSFGRGVVYGGEEEEQVELMHHHIKLYRNLLGLIGDFTAIAENPSASAVAAVMGVEDHVARPADAIEFLDRMLKSSDDPSVRRAIRIKLADLHKNSGGPTKQSLGQLEILITGKSSAE